MIDYNVVCNCCEQKNVDFPNPCKQTDKQVLACAIRTIKELEKKLEKQKEYIKQLEIQVNDLTIKNMDEEKEHELLNQAGIK